MRAGQTAPIKTSMKNLEKDGFVMNVAETGKSIPVADAKESCDHIDVDIVPIIEESRDCENETTASRLSPIRLESSSPDVPSAGNTLLSADSLEQIQTRAKKETSQSSVLYDQPGAPNGEAPSHEGESINLSMSSKERYSKERYVFDMGLVKQQPYEERIIAGVSEENDDVVDRQNLNTGIHTGRKEKTRSVESPLILLRDLGARLFDKSKLPNTDILNTLLPCAAGTENDINDLPPREISTKFTPDDNEWKQSMENVRKVWRERSEKMTKMTMTTNSTGWNSHRHSQSRKNINPRRQASGSHVEEHPHEIDVTFARGVTTILFSGELTKVSGEYVSDETLSTKSDWTKTASTIQTGQSTEFKDAKRWSVLKQLGGERRGKRDKEEFLSKQVSSGGVKISVEKADNTKSKEANVQNRKNEVPLTDGIRMRELIIMIQPDDGSPLQSEVVKNCDTNTEGNESNSFDGRSGPGETQQLSSTQEVNHGDEERTRYWLRRGCRNDSRKSPSKSKHSEENSDCVGLSNNGRVMILINENKHENTKKGGTFSGSGTVGEVSQIECIGNSVAAEEESRETQEINEKTREVFTAKSSKRDEAEGFERKLEIDRNEQLLVTGAQHKVEDKNRNNDKEVKSSVHGKHEIDKSALKGVDGKKSKGKLWPLGGRTSKGKDTHPLHDHSTETADEGIEESLHHAISVHPDERGIEILNVKDNADVTSEQQRELFAEGKEELNETQITSFNTPPTQQYVASRPLSDERLICDGADSSTEATSITAKQLPLDCTFIATDVLELLRKENDQDMNGVQEVNACTVIEGIKDWHRKRRDEKDTNVEVSETVDAANHGKLTEEVLSSASPPISGEGSTPTDNTGDRQLLVPSNGREGPHGDMLEKTGSRETQARVSERFPPAFGEEVKTGSKIDLEEDLIQSWQSVFAPNNLEDNVERNVEESLTNADNPETMTNKSDSETLSCLFGNMNCGALEPLADQTRTSVGEYSLSTIRRVGKVLAEVGQSSSKSEDDETLPTLKEGEKVSVTVELPDGTRRVMYMSLGPESTTEVKDGGNLQLNDLEQTDESNVMLNAATLVRSQWTKKKLFAKKKKKLKKVGCKSTDVK